MLHRKGQKKYWTDLSLLGQDKILQFSNFLKLRFFFWKSIIHCKDDFKVIVSIGSPYQTFSFIDKSAHFDID